MKLKLIALLLAATATACWAGPEPQVSILVATFEAPSGLDPKLVEHLAQAGLDVQYEVADYRTLTAERLNQYNALLMTYPCRPSSGADAIASFKSLYPIILDFVRAGGGLIVMSDEVNDSHLLLNQLLPDAEILPWSPVDESTLYRQGSYLQHYFCSTENIKPHAITEHVIRLWYPLADSPNEGKATQVLRLGSPWDGLVYANPSAYYYSNNQAVMAPVHAPEPLPIVASRTFGAGRIVVFASRSLNYFHHPYHRIFESICIERGDGLRLIENIVRWVTEPARTTGHPGGFTMPAETDTAPAINPDELANLDYYQRARLLGRKSPTFSSTDPLAESDGRNDYVGLIGAHSDYSRDDRDPNYASGGRGTVQQWCDAAKAAGYNYLVFTELFERMTPDKWNQLLADCQAQTNDTFIAIAGLEIQDVNGDKWAAFEMSRYPDANIIDETGTQIRNSPGFYFGLSAGSVFMQRCMLTPKNHTCRPWTQKFYGGFDVFSYKHGRELLSEALDYYLRCQANNFNLVPMTTHGLVHPNEVARAKGLLTHVRTEAVSQVPAKFRYTWYDKRDVYISSGPQLTSWTMHNGWQGLRDEQWRLQVAVTSDAPITSVTIYDRQRVFRRFFPNDPNFKTTLAGHHDEQRHLVLVAEDQLGRRLISSAVYVSDARQSTYMCTDLQNTINCARAITTQGKEEMFGPMGNQVTGWGAGVSVVVAIPWIGVLPESGFEFGFGGWRVMAGAVFPGLVPVPAEIYGAPSLDLAFNNGDCNILRNIYDWTYSQNVLADRLGIKVTSEHAGYTPRLYGLNVQHVRSKAKLTKEYAAPSAEAPQFVELTSTGLAPNGNRNYVFQDAQGNRTAGTRDADTALDFELTPGSYFAAYPDMWGSFCVTPRTGTYHLRLRGDLVQIGQLLTDTLPQGTELESDLIYICGKFGSTDDADFSAFVQSFGLAGDPHYSFTLDRGKVLSTRYLFLAQADQYAVEGRIAQTDMGSDLPFIVQGLCDNWDAGYLNRQTGVLRRVGLDKGTGRMTLNIDTEDAAFACGNLLICDNEAIRLSIFDRGDHWLLEAHNPTSEPVTTQLRTATWANSLIPPYDRQVLIPAGSTLQFELK
jgi:hypothetical protein